MALIFPLLEKLGPLGMQSRPKWTGERGIPELPTVPWDDNDMPPQINFGQADRPPIARETLPSNFGQCAAGKPLQTRMALFLNPARPRPYTEQTRTPAVLSARLPRVQYIFSGTSRDAAGAILGTCQVLVFRTIDKALVAQTTSDAVGAWAVLVGQQIAHFFVEYKAGSPDVFGTSPNTLTPV